MIIALQRLLKPSNGLVKGSFVPRLDVRHLQIRPYRETVSCPYYNTGGKSTLLREFEVSLVEDVRCVSTFPSGMPVLEAQGVCVTKD